MTDREVPPTLTAALHLADTLTPRYIRDPDDREDAAQEARLAIWRAWLRFDPARGNKFGTVAWHAAEGVLRRYWRDAGGARTRRCRYQQAQARKGVPLRFPETPAAALLPPLSLDTPISDGGGWLETMADPGPGPEDALLWREAVAATLAALRPDYAAVLVQRFAEGLTPPEVAERAGVKLARIHFLQARAEAAFVAAWAAQG
jgi:RNA polymerase sigma factor (sigma-70 family)